MSDERLEPGSRTQTFEPVCDEEKNVLHWQVIDLLQGKTTKAMPSVESTIDRIIVELDGLRDSTDIFADLATVLVEKQPHTNARMRVVEGALLTYFKCRCATACVKTYSPRYKLKGQKGTETYSARKKLAVNMVTELLKSDYITASNGQHDRFQNTKKNDDLADALLMCVKYLELPCPCFQSP